MNLLVLVVDDEPDVEVLFRQQFRHDLRAGRFTMEFAQSGPAALQRISDAVGVSLILILSDINMPGNDFVVGSTTPAARRSFPLLIWRGCVSAFCGRCPVQGPSAGLLRYAAATIRSSVTSRRML